MKKFLLHPETFKLDGGAMFGIIPKPLWSKKIIPDELNRILMSLRVVLLQTKNKNILIDTGIGQYHSEKFKQQFDISSNGSLLTLLEKQNLKASDITDIILTHLHFDHVGGLTEDNKPLFPNAMIHVHQKHYEYALSPTQRDSGSFQTHFFKPALDAYQEKNQIHFLQDEDGVILKDESEEITYKTSFGHTPFMIHPIFDQHMYMADLVPMSHHVHVPWVMGYDIEPGVTTVYKEKFYQYILDQNLTMIFEKFIFCIIGIFRTTNYFYNFIQIIYTY